MAGRLFDKSVTVRELMPQDLKIEIDQLSREQATTIAGYLAAVVGRAHARQMDGATRRSWKAELARNRSKTLDTPSWLWLSVVELMASHEAAYLDHCRRCHAELRIEFRAPDPACNPYLAFSLILAAGLKGIDEGYQLPPEATDNIYALTDEERRTEGIGSLPGSLRDALDAMEHSELAADALGDHIFENFLVNKRREWADYKADVTPFEIARYLGSL